MLYKAPFNAIDMRLNPSLRVPIYDLYSCSGKATLIAFLLWRERARTRTIDCPFHQLQGLIVSIRHSSILRILICMNLVAILPLVPLVKSGTDK